MEWDRWRLFELMYIIFFFRYGKETNSKSFLARRAEKVLAGEVDDGEGSEDEEDVEEEVEEDDPDVIVFQQLHGNMTQQVVIDSEDLSNLHSDVRCTTDIWNFLYLSPCSLVQEMANRI